jgi:hypothetical protein
MGFVYKKEVKILILRYIGAPCAVGSERQESVFE